MLLGSECAITIEEKMLGAPELQRARTCFQQGFPIMSCRWAFFGQSFFLIPHALHL